MQYVIFLPKATLSKGLHDFYSTVMFQKSFQTLLHVKSRFFILVKVIEIAKMNVEVHMHTPRVLKARVEIW